MLRFTDNMASICRKQGKFINSVEFYRQMITRTEVGNKSRDSVNIKTGNR